MIRTYKKNYTLVKYRETFYGRLMPTPVTAVQRTRLDTTNTVEILLTGKKCKFNVSFILTETSRVSFSGGYGITRGCVFVVLCKF